MNIQSITAKSVEKIAEHSTQISTSAVGGVMVGKWTLSEATMAVSIFVGLSTLIINFIYKRRQDIRDQERFFREVEGDE